MHVCTTQTGSNSLREEKIGLFLFNIVRRTRKQHCKSENIHEGKKRCFFSFSASGQFLTAKECQEIKVAVSLCTNK